MEAAIASRQWAKAVQILELQDSDMASRYYKKIGDHYASVGEYEVISTLIKCGCMFYINFVCCVKCFRALPLHFFQASSFYFAFFFLPEILQLYALFFFQNKI